MPDAGNIVTLLTVLGDLEIDAVKDTDLLWVAEEFLLAPLPPAWSKHNDDRGTAYYFNNLTGESTWHHPLRDVFRDAVKMQRKAFNDGGFWYVEDTMSVLEDEARQSLQPWIEIHDAHGDKMFYHKQ